VAKRSGAGLETTILDIEKKIRYYTNSEIAMSVKAYSTPEQAIVLTWI
jgi:hypothetical protein